MYKKSLYLSLFISSFIAANSSTSSNNNSAAANNINTNKAAIGYIRTTKGTLEPFSEKLFSAYKDAGHTSLIQSLMQSSLLIQQKNVNNILPIPKIDSKVLTFIKRLLAHEAKLRKEIKLEFPIKEKKTETEKQIIERIKKISGETKEQRINRINRIKKIEQIKDRRKNTLTDKLKRMKLSNDKTLLKELLYQVYFLNLSRELKSAVAYQAWKQGILRKENADLRNLRCVALQDAYDPGTDYLYQAVCNNDVEFAKHVIDLATQRQKNECFNSAVTDREDCPELVALFLKNGMNVNAPRNYGYLMGKPLFLSLFFNIEKPKIKTIKVLLEHGMNLNARHPQNHATPLHSVCSSSSDFDGKATALLLQYKANTETENLFGRTPLMLAAENPSYSKSNQIKKMELLLEGGANINAQNKRGQTALHWAIINHTMHVNPSKKYETAKLLIKHNADSTIKNHDGKTARDLAPFLFPHKKRTLEESSNKGKTNKKQKK